MKPDWKDAPEWARWVSQDDDGQWHWWENEPKFSEKGFWMGGGCLFQEAKIPLMVARLSVESRK